MRSIARNDKWNWKFDKSVWCVRYSWKIEEISIGYQKFNLKENFDEKGVSFHCICFEQSNLNNRFYFDIGLMIILKTI